jgi:adenine phosphoribosyltransferase
MFEKLIKSVPDFPKEGVMFKDITPVLEDNEAFKDLISKMAEASKKFDFNRMALVESRGFIFGSALSIELGIPFSLVRKPGKLPRETYVESYELEYGKDTLEVHKDSFNPGDKVLIIDDLLATGGTASAVEKLILKTGAKAAGTLCVIELEFLKGAHQLQFPFEALLKY